MKLRQVWSKKENVRKSSIIATDNKKLKVPRMGLEPTRINTHGPQPCLSTNFSTWVKKSPYKNKDFDCLTAFVTWLGFEPRTLTLKVWCSTSWAKRSVFYRILCRYLILMSKNTANIKQKTRTSLFGSLLFHSFKSIFYIMFYRTIT